jgi:plasmid stabilization system protein ParE
MMRVVLRRALLPRFPYAVYYLFRDEERAVVVAVLHQHRNVPPVTARRRDR